MLLSLFRFPLFFFPMVGGRGGGNDDQRLANNDSWGNSDQGGFSNADYGNDDSSFFSDDDSFV